MTDGTWRRIGHEFQHHLPFTFLAAAAVMAAAGTAREWLPPAAGAGEENLLIHLFHIFHPLHLFLSASATAAVFWRYDRRLGKAVVTGIVGAVGFCGVSDVLFPWAAGRLLGVEMRLHVCAIEEPALVWPFALLGTATGIASASVLTGRAPSIVSHAAHVLVSTVGSMLYLAGFGFTDWPGHLFPVLVTLVAAVLLPCCASDILFPLLLANPSGVHWCEGACAPDDGHGGPAHRHDG